MAFSAERKAKILTQLFTHEEVARAVALMPKTEWSEDPPVYFDGVHLVCIDIEKLHRFAKLVRFKRCWLHGNHYDVTTRNAMARVLRAGPLPCHRTDRGMIAAYKATKRGRRGRG